MGSVSFSNVGWWVDLLVSLIALAVIYKKKKSEKK